MYFSPGERALGDIVKKVEQGERLSKEDGIRILESYDLLAIGYMANLVRERKHGDNTFFACNDNLSEFELDKGGKHQCLEKTEEQIDYLIQLREEQDKNGTYQVFAPHLKFVCKETKSYITGVEDLKILAVSRLMLDNIQHIKAFWSMLGPKLSQVSLSFGVDDIEVIREGITVNQIVNMIKKADRKPLERDINYNIVREEF